MILSALCGLAVLTILIGRVSGRGAFVAHGETKAPRAAQLALRPLAAGAVVAVIWGWGVAQFPYLLPTSLKISQSAAPPETLGAVIVVFIAAAVLVLPSLGLLYWLSQRDLLEGER